ncbi:hypothetical protein [Microbacterium paulum]
MYGYVDGHLCGRGTSPPSRPACAHASARLRSGRSGSATEPTTPAALAAAPFAAAPGAVVDDEGLAHVGSPNGEQRALAAGRALATGRAHRPHGRAPTGSPGLDSITSQALAGLAPGESTEPLAPQGHIEHAASVVDDGDRTWPIVDLRPRAAKSRGLAHPHEVPAAGRGAGCL